MRVLKYNISLESLKSRKSGIIPSFCDGNILSFHNSSRIMIYDEESGEYVDTEESLKRTIGYGNYNMFPSDIKIPQEFEDTITDYTDIYVNVKKNNIYENINVDLPSRTLSMDNDTFKVLTYRTLVKWFKFFNDYFSVLKGGRCKQYSSATEYFDYELSNENQLLRENYSQMDELFEKRGGKNFYEWVKMNIFPTFDIDKDYSDYWGTPTLSYPEALRWKGWFEKTLRLINEEGGKEKYCCEYEEFIKRGGYDVYNALSEWVSEVSERIAENERNGLFTFESSINIPISISCSIKNIGLMSPLIDEWHSGRDYSIYGDEEYGAVTYYDGKTYVKNSNGGNGSKFDTEYKDIKFGNVIVQGDNTKQWDDYTEYYINSNPDKFVSVSSYCFNVKGEIIHNPTSGSVYEDYPITYGECVFYGDKIYNISNGLYVKYRNGRNPILDGREIKVETEIGKFPYCYVNGAKYTSEYVGGDLGIYFGIKKNEDNLSLIYNRKELVVSNKYYEVNSDGSVTVDVNEENELTYFVFDGYCEVEDKTYLIKDDKVYLTNGFDMDNNRQIIVEADDISWNGYEVMGDYLRIYYKYIERKADVISGYTSDKLPNVLDIIRSVDDIGNELPGIHHTKNPSGGTVKYPQPYEGEVLDIPYHVGNTRSVTYIGNDGEKRLYDGNIITDMEFYLLDLNGEKVKETIVHIGTKEDGYPYVYDANGNEIYNVDYKNNITAISEVIRRANEYLKLDEDGDRRSGVTIFNYVQDYIRCDVTYYMGAILQERYNGDVIEEIIKSYSIDASPSELYGNAKGTSITGSPITFSLNSIMSSITNNVSDGYYIRYTEEEGYMYYPGIKYVDTLTLNLDEIPYYIDNDTSYPINYYRIGRDMSSTIPNDNVNGFVNVNRSRFEMPILIYKKVDDKVVPNSDIFTSDKLFNDYNNMVISPLFRQDGYFGFDLNQKVESDIYVNRGSAAVLDRHIKLGEIESMEALENYGNKWFNIFN